MRVATATTPHATLDSLLLAVAEPLVIALLGLGLLLVLIRRRTAGEAANRPGGEG